MKERGKVGPCQRTLPGSVSDRARRSRAYLLTYYLLTRRSRKHTSAELAASCAVRHSLNERGRSPTTRIIRLPMRGLSLPLCAALARGATLRPAFAPVCRAGPLRGVVSPAEPPRLMLMSSGLTTPELEATFRGMLHEAGAGADPCITMVVTGQERRWRP